jgi:predicted transcriptional regulator of viral defense system
MKYYDLKNQLEPLVIFSPQEIYLADPDFRQATLYDWEKSGKVVKLKSNCYVFGDFVPENYDYYLLSNFMYNPSYISTELALNHFGVIPEAVSVITAVTTNKTQSFTALETTFSYQTIRPKLFFGYDLLEVRGHGVKIASLEKAILDYLYLNSSISSEDDFLGLRWNKQVLHDEIKTTKFETYLAIFSNTALTQRVNILRKYLEK